jgi:hypothetical protein
MTERTSFIRKIGYGVAIAVLAVAMMWLSAPATTTREGGKLAQLRQDYGLAQMSIGEVDPASETMRLATLGLRGIAVNVLWEQANHYKKVEDWTNLTATLEQLAKLQPNFITFWKFQAWNLTYNVSVEFDDFRDRYYYVRRGIEFLKEGERYNVDNPSLLWDLGWFVGQKIGRADEHKQYRKLFREDEQFHPDDRAPDDRDNWLVGKEFYLRAIDSVDNKGNSLGRKSPRDFYSSPAKSTMNYAEAIEEEGLFDKARRAWIKAADEWREFGTRVIEHSTGVQLRLGSEPQLAEELKELRAKLEAMLPGTRDKLTQELRAELTPEERQILDTPQAQLTPEQAQKRYDLDLRMQITDRAVADRIAQEKPELAKQALQLAGDIQRTDTQYQYTQNYKRDANYDYWQTRADFEQTSNAIEARRLMHEAQRAVENDADLETAKRLYEEGFARWRAVANEFPTILDEDGMTGEDILDFIKKYRDVLGQLDQQIADDFPLWDVIEKFDREQEFTQELADRQRRASGQTAPPAESPPDAAAPTEAQPTDATPAPTSAEPTPTATPEPEPATAEPANTTSEPATPEPAAPAPASSEPAQ